MKQGVIILLLALIGTTWSASAQDLIVKKDGTKIEAKVLEIGETDIKYKKQSNLSGPTYLVSVANVVCIRFENGSTDIFSQADYDRLNLLTTPQAAQQQPVQAAPAIPPTATTVTPSDGGAAPWAGRYEVGDYFNENGLQGIVIEIDEQGHGKLMSLGQGTARWSEEKKGEAKRLGFTDEHDGAVNQAALARMVERGETTWEAYPAFKWCHDLGEGWYLPAINEILLVGHVYNNGRLKFDRKARERFNDQLQNHNGEKMHRLMYYFSSTEGEQPWAAMTTHMNVEPPFIDQTAKNIAFLVRAMHRF